jgi:predicted amidohydrolase
MKKLKFAVNAWDLSDAPLLETSDFYWYFLEKIETQLIEGANVVLYPEYSSAVLLGNSRFSKKDGLLLLSKTLWEDFAPQLLKLSKTYDALICAGTAPFLLKNKLFNRSLSFASGKAIPYDKQALTPWEKSFSQGKKTIVFNWKNYKFSILTCLDIEMPEYAVQLKKRAPLDFILVPSATSDFLGSERVHRCAKARAVELGTIVAVSALRGKQAGNPLVDENVGLAQVYSPSQEAFQSKIKDELSLIPLIKVKESDTVYFELEKQLIQKLHKKNIKG